MSYPGKARILTITGVYLPGYKAGGPVRTLANLVDHLHQEFDFFILTRDRDLGDASPYHGVPSDTWVQQGFAQVCYLSPRHQRLPRFRQHLISNRYDILYLNSFFASITRKLLLLRRLGKIPSRPIIIAPRGEFSPGALQLKWKKKTGISPSGGKNRALPPAALAGFQPI
jgi:hypothetical protein